MIVQILYCELNILYVFLSHICKVPCVKDKLANDGWSVSQSIMAWETTKFFFKCVMSDGYDVSSHGVSSMVTGWVHQHFPCHNRLSLSSG
jgi:hypothetical protein